MDNGLTKTCPERRDSRVTNPSHPPHPQHTIGGTLHLGMRLLPSPPFAERYKEAKEQLGGKTHSVTQAYKATLKVGHYVSVKKVQHQIKAVSKCFTNSVCTTKQYFKSFPSLCNKKIL